MTSQKLIYMQYNHHHQFSLSDLPILCIHQLLKRDMNRLQSHDWPTSNSLSKIPAFLKREPTNVAYRNAVAVFKEDQVVGHVPCPKYFTLLKRDINKAFAKLVGEKVNRGAGYGLVYHLYGQELVDSLIASGLILVYMRPYIKQNWML